MAKAYSSVNQHYEHFMNKTLLIGSYVVPVACIHTFPNHNDRQKCRDVPCFHTTIPNKKVFYASICLKPLFLSLKVTGDSDLKSLN